MNKSALIDAVAAETGATKAATETTLDSLSTVLHEQLSNGNEVTLHGIGKFEVGARKARTGRNPRTGERIAIPAKNSVVFKAAKALKDAVN